MSLVGDRYESLHSIRRENVRFSTFLVTLKSESLRKICFSLMATRTFALFSYLKKRLEGLPTINVLTVVYGVSLCLTFILFWSEWELLVYFGKM